MTKGLDINITNFVDQMLKSEKGQKKKLNIFLQDLTQRKHQYTMEHFYAVKQIEGPCLKYIKQVREKRGLLSFPPFPVSHSDSTASAAILREADQPHLVDPT